jgi:hypothetical protein
MKTICKMKTKILFFLFLMVIFFFTSCRSAQCDCQNNQANSKRKSQVSLIKSQKNSNFVPQKGSIINV